MLVIPAIDLRNGKCVRLIQGKADAETIFSDDPVAVAINWQEKGARLLHLVDLDGAFTGKPKNLDIISKIVESVNIPVEMGGGIRDQKTLEDVFKAGVKMAILGTKALTDPEFTKTMCKEYNDKIAVGIDAKDGITAIHGWTESGGKSAIDLAIEMKDLGVKTIIYTDIKRDGMLTGPNISATKKISMAVPGVDVIASGGVSSIDDVKALKEIEKYGVKGMIIGKALYTGNIQLEDAIYLADS